MRPELVHSPAAPTHRARGRNLRSAAYPCRGTPKGRLPSWYSYPARSPDTSSCRFAATGADRALDNSGRRRGIPLSIQTSAIEAPIEYPRSIILPTSRQVPIIGGDVLFLLILRLKQ